MTACQIAVPPAVAQPAISTASPTTSPNNLHSATQSKLNLELASVRALRIEYKWDGLSRIAPTARAYVLTPSAATAFTGPATFVVAANARQPGRDQLTVSVPNAAIAEFFTILNTATLADKPYKPRRSLDDYPYVAIGLDTAQGKIVIDSESVGNGYAPWKATIAGKTFVIDSDVPNRALDKLTPYLHEDVLQRLIKEAQSRS